MTDKKKTENEGIEFPEGFNETKKEVPVVAENASKEEKIEAGKEIIAQGEKKVEKSDKPAVINRSQIKSWQDALKALPTGLSQTPLNENRIQVEIGFAAQLIRKNPGLQKCTPTTIYDAVVFAARINLTLNPALGLCHLVPRKADCCLDIDYKGWIAITREAGLIKDAFAVIVFEDEIFERYPAEGRIVHVPKDAKNETEHNARQIKGAYSVLIHPDGSRSEPEWIPAWELEKIAKVSPAFGSSFSPRNNWRDEMHKKSCFKRHLKKFRAIQNNQRIEEMFEHEKQNDENNLRTYTEDVIAEDVTVKTIIQ